MSLSAVAPNRRHSILEEIGSLDAGTIIRIVGVGGAGGNFVDHMIRRGIRGVEFVLMDTDTRALKRSFARKTVQLGNTGFGSGAKPAAGRIAALEARPQITAALKGAHMAFIVAGMGGGTGGGAGPIIADVARELGLLTVAAVTTPFSFEGYRLKETESGIAELQRHVDSPIVISNESSMHRLGASCSMDEAFNTTHDLLCDAVGGIVEMTNYPSLIGLDFEDVRTVMSVKGIAKVSSAYSSGVDRAHTAIAGAITSTLLSGINLSRTKGLLVIIRASSNLKMREVNQVMKTARQHTAEETHVVFGAVYDENMQKNIRVTLIALGHNREPA